ncbi:hypothetical protein DY000_02053930 [Brassica cretica]|uniref:Uncharacterized protein n=1 Tax=Brassica cretica TaxID=69181 RepID=A0ABQ7AF65_BRACR|nr:hypothetical protein DY000_02053930 [Brassica cretica]
MKRQSTNCQEQVAIDIIMNVPPWTNRHNQIITVDMSSRNRLEHAKAGARAPILISTSPSRVMKWQQEAEQESCAGCGKLVVRVGILACHLSRNDKRLIRAGHMSASQLILAHKEEYDDHQIEFDQKR